MSEPEDTVQLLNLGEMSMVTDFSASEASLITNLGLVSGMMLRLMAVPGLEFDAYMAAGQDSALATETFYLLPATSLLDVIAELQSAYRAATGRAAR